MPPLSPNFDQSEVERDAPLPPETIPGVRHLFCDIVELIREHCGCPLRITSGYRPVAFNTAAHGVAHSEHIYTATCCAVDFVPMAPPSNLYPLFDWIRLASGLPFDRVGLEWSPQDASKMIIHVSWSTTPRGTAFKGPEGGPYLAVSGDEPISLADVTVDA